MMDITVQQKDCDALAGLFQHIVTDLRVCFVVFDFMLTFVLIRIFTHNLVVQVEHSAGCVFSGKDLN